MKYHQKDWLVCNVFWQSWCGGSWIRFHAQSSAHIRNVFRLSSVLKMTLMMGWSCKGILFVGVMPTVGEHAVTVISWCLKGKDLELVVSQQGGQVLKCISDLCGHLDNLEVIIQVMRCLFTTLQPFSPKKRVLSWHGEHQAWFFGDGCPFQWEFQWFINHHYILWRSCKGCFPGVP